MGRGGGKGHQGGSSRKGRGGRGGSHPWINAQVIAASDTKDLQHLMDTIVAYLPQMNLVNLSTALHRLARLGGSDPNIMREVNQHPHLEQLLDKICFTMQMLEAADVQSQTVSNVIWSLATVRRVHRPLILVISTICVATMSLFKPFELSTTLWAVAKLSSLQGNLGEDRSVFVAAAKQIKARAPEYGFRCLATVAWAYSTARDFNLSLFQAISAQMVPLASTANCQEIANTVWAFGTADFHDPALFEALAEHAALRLEEFKPQEISNTLWGFATNSYFHDVFYARASQVVQNMDPRMLQPQHLANILWAFSRVRPRHFITQQIILALLPLCMAQLDSFKPQEVSSTLLAIAKAMTKADDADCNTPELWQVHGKVSSYFDSCVSWILPRLSEFSVQSLANTVSAFALVPVQGAGMLLDYVSGEVKHRCSGCDVSTKVHLLKGYALLPSAQFDDVRVMLAHGVLAELDTVRQQELHGLGRSFNIVPGKAKGGKSYSGENLQEEVRRYLISIIQHKQLPAAPATQIDDGSDDQNYQTTALQEGVPVTSQTLGKETRKHQSRGRGRTSLPARDFAQQPPLCTIDEASSVSMLASDLNRMAESHIHHAMGQGGTFNPQNPQAWIPNGMPRYAAHEHHLREQQMPLGAHHMPEQHMPLGAHQMPPRNLSDACSVDYNLTQLAAQMRLGASPTPLPLPSENHPCSVPAWSMPAHELASTHNGFPTHAQMESTAPFVHPPSSGSCSSQQGPLGSGSHPTDANSPNLTSMLAHLMNNNSYQTAMRFHSISSSPEQAAQLQAAALPFNPPSNFSTHFAPSHETPRPAGDMYPWRPENMVDSRLAAHHMGTSLASSLGAAARQQGVHPAAGASSLNTNTRLNEFSDPMLSPLMAHQQQQAFGHGTGDPAMALLTSAMLGARSCGAELGGLTQQALVAQMLAAQSPAAHAASLPAGFAQSLPNASSHPGLGGEAQKRSNQTMDLLGSHYATGQNSESRQSMELLSAQMLAAARLGMTQPFGGSAMAPPEALVSRGPPEASVQRSMELLPRPEASAQRSMELLPRPDASVQRSMELLGSQYMVASAPAGGCSQLGSTVPAHMSADASEGNKALNQFMTLQNMATGASTSLGLPPMDMRSGFPTSNGGDMGCTGEKQTVECNDDDDDVQWQNAARSSRIDDRTRRLIVKNSFLHVEDSESDKEEELPECNSSVRSSSMPSSIGRESRGPRNLPSSELLQMLARFNSSQTSMPSNDGAT